jgi:Fe2+ or Zn2+ uptake regulation protein
MNIMTTWLMLILEKSWSFTTEDLEKLQHEIAKKKGYELVDHSMILHVRKIES